MPKTKKKGGALMNPNDYDIKRAIYYVKSAEEQNEHANKLHTQSRRNLLKAKMNLVDVIASNEALSVIHKLIMLSDVKKKLQSEDVTFFAPNNEFMKNEPVEELMGDREKLNLFLDDLILKGRIHTNQVNSGIPMIKQNENNKPLEINKNPQNSEIVISHKGEPVAKVVHPNLNKPNHEVPPKKGIVHIIGNVESSGPVKTITSGLNNAVGNAAELAQGARETTTKTVEKATNFLKNIFSGTKPKGTTESSTTTQGGGRTRRRRRKSKRKSHKKHTKRRRIRRRH